MLNESELITQVEAFLETHLKLIPLVTEVEWVWEPPLAAVARADFIATFAIGGEEIQLVGETKKNLQPRQIHDVIRQVKEHIFHLPTKSAYPLVVSEYISPRTAETLVKQNISYFDLLGNCRLSFANVYIEKIGEKPKSLARRGVKSLFGVKSSRMLRLMLNNPARTWQVKQLAMEADLSFGQVSNVRRALLDQQYAMELEGKGIQLTEPASLLHDWQKVYKKNVVQGNTGYYSLLNGDERQKAIEGAFMEAEESGAQIMFSGLSAARWLAPYARAVSERFYADKSGREILKKHLGLREVDTGPNVIIEEPRDLYLFEEAIECGPGLKCTSEIQTYLDLYVSGEREQEAAGHLESHILRKKWNDS